MLVFDPRSEKVVSSLSHPWFNDLHHVARIDGRLHVVSTGLDCLLVMDDADQDVAEVHSTTGRSPWERFDRDTDYRLVATTKPHQAHPNYVFARDGGRFVSRFEQRDAWSIDRKEGSARIATDPIHDGVPHGASTWFTVVSGEVVEMDLAAGRVLNRYNLDQIGAEGGRPLGWCRGIHIEADRTLLAFSRLRPTALKQNLAWLRPALCKQPEPSPTRICAYDLPGGRKLQSWSLEDKGISSIFSILPASPTG